MKLTSAAFGKWYIIRSFQGFKVFEEGAKNDGKSVRDMREAYEEIILRRLFGEGPETETIGDHIQRELAIREEMKLAVDPTGSLMEKYKEQAGARQAAQMEVMS